jgi:hypothetical protein
MVTSFSMVSDASPFENAKLQKKITKNYTIVENKN